MPFLVYALCCAIWSTTYYGIRVSLQGYPPLWGASLRFLLAVALLYALSRPLMGLFGPPGERPGRRENLAIALAALLNSCAYGITYFAETQITGGTAALLTAASPFFTALFARLAGLEPLRARRLLGVVCGFAGIALLFSEGARSGMPGAAQATLATPRLQLWAMGGMLGASALLWPAYNILIKRYAGALNPLRANLRFLGWTAVFITVGALLFHPQGITGPPGWRPTAAVLYLAVLGSVVAWTGYFWMIRRLDLTTLSTMVFVQPLLALGVDVLAGDGRLSPRGYGGALLVLGGVALTALTLPESRRAGGGRG